MRLFNQIIATLSVIMLSAGSAWSTGLPQPVKTQAKKQTRERVHKKAQQVRGDMQSKREAKKQQMKDTISSKKASMKENISSKREERQANRPQPQPRY